MNREMDINFVLSDFNGPLDLLYELIKKKNVDIFEVDMIELATQYLEIIKNISNKDIDIASEYLVMASELIYIKSRLILQDPEEAIEVEEDKNRILMLIAEYQKFKEIASELKTKESRRKLIHIKESDVLKDWEKDRDPAQLDGFGTVTKLMVTLRRMFERTHAFKLKQLKFETFNLSPLERTEQIRELINGYRDNEQIPFELIFKVPTMNHFVITLISVLDMVRKQELFLIQENQFDEIIIKKGSEY